jgi:hypothetical protein
MNNLLEYSHMYGLNFYLKNRFHNFEKEQAQEGYFFVGKESFEKVLKKYGKTYRFRFLEEYINKNRDGERVMQLYHFMKISKSSKVQAMRKPLFIRELQRNPIFGKCDCRNLL